ncbi:MAG: tRNA dihydrouridine synthase DusB [Deltaproteobacteria bacterium]|nr:tRNA dihydrouridine synthase DusB [Deltaproteobacteria bacterium]
MLPWLSPDRFPLYLAPMAGVTDMVFRSLCKELGADVMVTEFVSAEGIMQADGRTRKYTEFDDVQRPLGVQLFGADGARMGEAARKISDWKKPDFIDINFGCPVNKVVAKNGGSSLLKDCPLLASVAVDLVKASPVPVTAKMRIGWDHDHINAVEVARILEDSGIQAIAVHGRTRSQGYTGLADWDVIAQVADAVKIPVIGNGDIRTADDVRRMIRMTGCDGVLVGRGALGNPWIFKDMMSKRQGQQALLSPTSEERERVIRHHLTMVVAVLGESIGVRNFRKHLLWYTKGLRGGSRFRQWIGLTKDREGLLNELHEFLNSVDQAARTG